LNNDFSKNLLSIPNLISFARILLVPVFVFYLVRDEFLSATVVLAFASLSDLLDGFIARRWSLRTELGAYLDPAADKILFVSTFVVFTVKGEIPVWFTGLIIVREIIVVTGSFYFRSRVNDFRIMPEKAGKWSVFFQILILICILLKKLIPSTVTFIRIFFLPIVCIALFLSMFSGLQYILRGWQLFKKIN